MRYGIASLDDLLINPSHGMANLFALDGRPYQHLHLTGSNMSTNMTDIAAPARKQMKNVVRRAEKQSGLTPKKNEK